MTGTEVKNLGQIHGMGQGRSVTATEVKKLGLTWQWTRKKRNWHRGEKTRAHMAGEKGGWPRGEKTGTHMAGGKCGWPRGEKHTWQGTKEKCDWHRVVQLT